MDPKARQAERRKLPSGCHFPQGLKPVLILRLFRHDSSRALIQDQVRRRAGRGFARSCRFGSCEAGLLFAWGGFGGCGLLLRGAFGSGTRGGEVFFGRSGTAGAFWFGDLWGWRSIAGL